MAGWDQSYLCAFGPSNIDGYSTIIYNYNYIQTPCHLWMFRGLRHPSSMLMSPDGVMPPDGNIWQPTVVKTWSTSNPGHLGLPGPVRLASEFMLILSRSTDDPSDHELWYWMILGDISTGAKAHKNTQKQGFWNMCWWHLVKKAMGFGARLFTFHNALQAREREKARLA